MQTPVYKTFINFMEVNKCYVSKNTSHNKKNSITVLLQINALPRENASLE